MLLYIVSLGSQRLDYPRCKCAILFGLICDGCVNEKNRPVKIFPVSKEDTKGECEFGTEQMRLTQETECGVPSRCQSFCGHNVWASDIETL
jgi:hypothetical protein